MRTIKDWHWSDSQCLCKWTFILWCCDKSCVFMRFYTISKTRCITCLKNTLEPKEKLTDKWKMPAVLYCLMTSHASLESADALWQHLSFMYNVFMITKLPSHCQGGLEDTDWRLWHFLSFCLRTNLASFSASRSRESGRPINDTQDGPCHCHCGLPGERFAPENQSWQWQLFSWWMHNYNKLFLIQP